MVWSLQDLHQAWSQCDKEGNVLHKLGWRSVWNPDQLLDQTFSPIHRYESSVPPPLPTPSPSVSADFIEKPIPLSKAIDALIVACKHDLEKGDMISLDDLIEKIEGKIIECALTQSDGNRTEASKLLKISFRSMRYRLKKLAKEAKEEN